MAAQDSQEFKVLFALFDVDNSGTLTRDELKQLLQSPDPFGPQITEEKLAEYVKLADADGSGDISVDEFVQFMSTNVTPGSYSLKSIFRTIDKNGDGSIEKSEFDEAKTNNKDLNPTLVSLLEKIFAASGKPEINYEEFVQVVNEYYNNLDKN